METLVKLLQPEKQPLANEVTVYSTPSSVIFSGTVMFPLYELSKRMASLVSVRTKNLKPSITTYLPSAKLPTAVSRATNMSKNLFIS